MYINKSHYSGMNSPEFIPSMKALANKLPKYRKQHGVDVWFVTGKSGIVAQTALIMLGSDEPVCAVRKPEEKSHGSTFEGNCSVTRDGPLRVGIVDDFVDSGATVTRVLGQIAEARRWQEVGTFELAAVVGYKKGNATEKACEFYVPDHFHQEEAVDGRYVTVPYKGV